jgi:tetratricopeptide (TPR) repeat protein
LTASAAKLPGNIEPTGPALAVGMLEFRRGQFEKALEILPQNGDDLQVPLSAFFQAMALHHLGKKEEAKKRFMGGSTELAKRIPSPEGKENPDYMPPRWVVWTVLHNARREAESLLADSISGTDEKILRLLFQGDISKAIDELDVAIKAAPDNVVLRKQRANLCIRNQQWCQAARDLEAMLDDDDSNSTPWLGIGALFALSADEKEYQRYCRAMAQRFKDSETTNDPERVVKIAMLRPGVDEKTLPIERFEAFFQSDSPPSWLPTWGATARALLEFRRGNAQRSLDLVRQCEAVLGKATSPSRSLHALNCAIQSLALAKLEKVNEARDALAQAAEILDPEMERISQGEQWSHDYLIAQVIRREAERAINK